LIRQFLTESLLLAAAGSAMGLGIAYFGVRALAQLNVLDPDFRFHLSLFVLASCAGLTLLTTILFGLIPALRATRMKLAESMKEGGMSTETLSRSLLSKFGASGFLVGGGPGWLAGGPAPAGDGQDSRGFSHRSPVIPR
jgi:predicted lysophospholipase L1 biosynthesis ABC-type transport system permease subunit